MNTSSKFEYYKSLVEELRKLPSETEWLEFKQNNANPEDIGEYISALANSAAYQGKTHGYLIWGIEDEHHDIVGTSFRYASTKIGNEELENWLLRQLAPKIEFQFYELDFDGKLVCLLEIQAATRQPVQFKNQEFIRIGTYRKKLKDHAERERRLWRVFDATPFERQIAESHVTGQDVLKLIDFPAYFDLLNVEMPTGSEEILKALADDDLIASDDAGRWNIFNIGGILFAKDLNEFSSLKRKALRVILYRGDGRIETIREQVGSKGYASGFEGLVGFVNGLLPSNEVIGQALRKKVPMFPELAVRELIANALIHQDFSQTGNGPMIEIFDSRMEITNPGLPLVDTHRFLNSPPKSRNEGLASLLRRIGICEERGTGVDKVVFQTEFYQLPAPSFETFDTSTKSVLFAHKELNEMDKADKVRACYLHACLRLAERKEMTNSSLRERFQVKKQNRAIITRIINDTLNEKLIIPSDPNQGRKYARYLPFWVRTQTS